MYENTVYEWCEFCNNDVELPNALGIYACPSCGELILPCSLCDTDDEEVKDCDSCIYNKCVELWRKERE